MPVGSVFLLIIPNSNATMLTEGSAGANLSCALPKWGHSSIVLASLWPLMPNKNKTKSWLSDRFLSHALNMEDSVSFYYYFKILLTIF